MRPKTAPGSNAGHTPVRRPSATNPPGLSVGWVQPTIPYNVMAGGLHPTPSECDHPPGLSVGWVQPTIPYSVMAGGLHPTPSECDRPPGLSVGWVQPTIPYSVMAGGLHPTRAAIRRECDCTLASFEPGPSSFCRFDDAPLPISIKETNVPVSIRFQSYDFRSPSRSGVGDTHRDIKIR